MCIYLLISIIWEDAVCFSEFILSRPLLGIVSVNPGRVCYFIILGYNLNKKINKLVYIAVNIIPDLQL